MEEVNEISRQAMEQDPNGEWYVDYSFLLDPTVMGLVRGPVKKVDAKK